MNKLIRHNSKLRLIWDILILVLTFVSISYITYEGAFIQTTTIEGSILIYCIDLFFLLSIWINSRTSYRKLGIEVVDLNKIRSRYLQRDFIWDLISVLPFELLFIFSDLSVFGVSIILIIRLCRLIRLRYVITVFRKWENQSWLNTGMVRISRLFYLIIIIYHLVACTWFFSSYAENLQEDSWVVREQLYDKPIGQKYLRSLYWSTTSLTTVGFGDIVPKRNVEYVISIVVMVLGASAYALIIGNIASLISTIDISKSTHRNKVNAAFHFLHARQVEYGIIEKIENYYEYSWEKRKGVSEENLFNDLPSALRLEVLEELLKEQISSLPIFSHDFNDIKIELLKSLTLEIFSPETYIVRSGEIGKAIYFLSIGSADILNEKSEIVDQFVTGDYFGDLSLILKEKRTGSVRTNEFCELFVLKEKQFNRIKNEYPKFSTILKEASEKRSEKSLSLFYNDVII